MTHKYADIKTSHFRGLTSLTVKPISLLNANEAEIKKKNILEESARKKKQFLANGDFTEPNSWLSLEDLALVSPLEKVHLDFVSGSGKSENSRCDRAAKQSTRLFWFHQDLGNVVGMSDSHKQKLMNEKATPYGLTITIVP